MSSGLTAGDVLHALEKMEARAARQAAQQRSPEDALVPWAALRSAVSASARSGPRTRSGGGGGGGGLLEATTLTDLTEYGARVYSSRKLRLSPHRTAGASLVFSAPNGAFFTLADVCCCLEVAMRHLGADYSHSYFEGITEAEEEHPVQDLGARYWSQFSDGGGGLIDSELTGQCLAPPPPPPPPLLSLGCLHVLQPLRHSPTRDPRTPPS